MTRRCQSFSAPLGAGRATGLLAEALLSFADFAGVGIKTTLGMGGVEHIPLL